MIAPLYLKDLVTLSQIRLFPDENLEQEPSKRKVAYQGIKHILEKHPDGVPLDPVVNMKIEDPRIGDLVKVSLYQ